MYLLYNLFYSSFVIEYLTCILLLASILKNAQTGTKKNFGLKVNLKLCFPVYSIACYFQNCSNDWRNLRKNPSDKKYVVISTNARAMFQAEE